VRYAEDIKQFIIRDILSNEDYVELNFQDNLIMTGIIDSVGIQSLISFLERKYNIEIEDQDILPENFENIDAICSFISKKTQ